MSEDAFAGWIAGIVGTEQRRIVRRVRRRILVSKFEEGFAPRLLERLAGLDALTDLNQVEAAFAAWCVKEPDTSRVAAWRQALLGLLDAAAAERGFSPVEIAEVRVGIDSVAALLDTVLWSSPAVGGSFTPRPGEVAAYRDALAQMEATPGIFTRIYGSFEGARVENHCPGAMVARRLLAQGWQICTGTAPPTYPLPLS